MKILFLIITHLLASSVFSCSSSVKTLILSRIDNGYILHLNSGIITQYYSVDEDYSKIVDFSLKDQTVCDSNNLQEAFKVNSNIDSTLKALSKHYGENINHQDVYISNFKNDNIDSIHINLLIKNLNPTRVIINKGKKIIDLISNKTIGSMDDEINPNKICGILSHHPQFLKSTGKICNNLNPPKNHSDLMSHHIKRLRKEIMKSDFPAMKEYFQKELDRILETNN